MDIKDNPLFKRLKAHLRVTKVVCTRSVKGRGGDNFVGFSSVWDSIQDDAGGAVELLPTMGEGDVQIAQSQMGMTLREAKMASLLVGMQADIAAHDNAACSGNITSEYRDQAVRAIKGNYARLIVDLLGGETSGEKDE